jgi:hypothetical protein
MASYLSGASPGQPAAVQAWIKFWIDVVNVNPTLFAYLVAAETALAFALILGGLSNLAYLGGNVLSLMICSTAAGFGGPFAKGATDIGAAIIYRPPPARHPTRVPSARSAGCCSPPHWLGAQYVVAHDRADLMRHHHHRDNRIEPNGTGRHRHHQKAAAEGRGQGRTYHRNHDLPSATAACVL